MPELAIALTTIGVLVALAAPGIRRAADAASVRSAVTSAASTLAAARQTAIARGTMTTVRLDTARARIVVLVAAGAATAAAETVLVRDLRDAHGVRLGATRLELRFAASGLGYGTSNTSLVLRRGRSADTVIVSRLGRVRH